MNCPWVKSQITLYLYNELDDPERIEIEQHAENCPECASLINAERRLLRAMDARPRPPLDANLLASCRIQLSEALEEQPRGRFAWSGWNFGAVLGRLRVSFQPAMAAVLLAAGFAGGWGVSSYRTVGTITGVANGDGPIRDINNVTNIHSIQADPQGNLEIVLDTTRRRIIRGSAQDPQIEQILVHAATSYANPGIRLDSIELLKDRAADLQIRNALVAAVREDANPGVRLKALAALKDFSGNDAVKQVLLEALMQDDNVGVRIEAIDQLSRLRDASTVPALQRVAAGDPNSYVRLRSASALRDLNAPEIY